MSGPLTGKYGVRMGTKCAVHAHDAWVPLNDHHIWPLGDGGPDTAENKITVCANAHYSIHAVMDHIERRHRFGFAPEWEFMRRFSPAVRDLARQGWEQIQAHRA